MNLNKVLNRYNTNSLKFDFKAENNKPEAAMPMWLADMDFCCSKKIAKALAKRAKDGVLGYAKTDENYIDAIDSWYKKHFGVELKQNWLVNTPGVVFALATAVKAFTAENDCVIVMQPVYHHFVDVIKNNNRKVVSSDLILTDWHYEINFKDFENKIKKNNVKLFLLCSPHNPVGRVWTKQELDKIVDICKNNNVVIVSDEIHSDFVWSGNQISIISYLDIYDKIVFCSSASKTFNIPGLQTANIFIPNEKLREDFKVQVRASGFSGINIMGLIACESGYLFGEKWLDKIKTYIVKNIQVIDEFLHLNIPKVKIIIPEGTFLIWVDFRELNLSDDKLNEILLNDAKVWFNPGLLFGKSGSGFQRINVATSRKNILKMLNNLKKSLEKYN